MKFVKRVLLMLLLSPALPAFAEEFPSRPITLVVPFSAGGPGDVIARLLGTSMSATLKQAVLIENVVGAGGTLGTNRVAKATPDGYTLLLMHVGQATAPALYAKLPFDPVGDFAPIGLVTDVPMILVARTNFPAKDLKELVAHVHERHPLAPPAQLELEELPVPGKRLVDVTDLQRHVVDPDEPRGHASYGTGRPSAGTGAATAV